ncbi:hypothetical protein C8J56DRAFT_138836 [Mycena floridula]|nr:hypothetical protein C8J56DRAFT_138836 [Mycena floridula]
MSIFSVLTGPQLVAAVDDFLADVSCESNVGGETVEAIRTVAEACFFEKSISVHEFLQMAATSLKYYPDLARNLNAFLDGSGERLEIVVESVDNISTVDLLVVHGPDGGHIYPLSKAKPVPPISNTTILRALLEKDPVEPDFTNATASSTWAGAIAELLQHELV